MKNLLLPLTRNAASLAGAALTTATAILILTFFGLELIGFHGGPYVGIITFLLLPGIFVFGLLLIPVGIVLERRRERRAALRGEPMPRFPVRAAALRGIRF